MKVKLTLPVLLALILGVSSCKSEAKKEATKRADSFFARNDVNHDDQITKEEWTSEGKKILESISKNHPQIKGQNEKTPNRPQAFGFGAQSDKTREERFSKVREQQFNGFDLDKDGIITHKEAVESFLKMAESH